MDDVLVDMGDGTTRSVRGTYRELDATCCSIATSSSAFVVTTTIRSLPWTRIALRTRKAPWPSRSFRGSRSKILDRFVAAVKGQPGGGPRLFRYTQETLEQADRFIDELSADGGTELLGPLTAATELAPDGVIVLLTDGQVGNEAEIATKVFAARKTARFYTFGIGTNVSDALAWDSRAKPT